MNIKPTSDVLLRKSQENGGGATGRGRPGRRRKRDVESFLQKARVAIENGLSDEPILARLSDFGYDRERLATGRELCDRLQDALIDQRDARGTQHGSTDRLRIGRDEARRLYVKTLQLARMALRDDPGAREALALGGKRKQDLAGWLEQALRFYDNILEREDRVRALAGFNHDRDRLAAEREIVARVRELNTERDLKKGDARAATREKAAARAALQAFMRGYRMVIGLALADEPAWRVKLGSR